MTRVYPSFGASCFNPMAQANRSEREERRGKAREEMQEANMGSTERYARVPARIVERGRGEE